MILYLRKNEKIKDDKCRNMGFTEIFKPYKYLETGSITIRCVAMAGFPLQEAYVYRDKDFVPTSEIERQMGIEKYISAKKPFYSLLVKDGIPQGNAILDAKIGIELDTNKYLPDKSSYKIYTPVKGSIRLAENDDVIMELSLLSTLTPAIKDWLNMIGEQVCMTGYNRAEFLRMRMQENLETETIEEPEESEGN